jgi:hypothetical protein
VTAQPLAPVIPSSGVSAARQHARPGRGPAAAAGPAGARAADSADVVYGIGGYARLGHN